jgi:hypothetical protein
MSTGSTLYYPFIHPRNGNYLKSALIYWDRVRRIVPDSVTHGDHVLGDDRDNQMLTARGFLVSTRPEPYDEAAAKCFFEHIEPHIDRFQIDIETAKDLASRNRGFHIEKFGDSVLCRLKSLGLAHAFGDWVAMHDELGAFYMFCLASEMAKGMAAPLYTDSPSDAGVGQTLLFTPRPGDPTSDTLVRLGICMPSPNQLKDIPMDNVADFAERRRAEKLEFRTAIEGIIAAAGAYGDLNAMNDYLTSERARIEKAVANLHMTIHELGVGAISGAAKITVPTAMAAGLAVLPLSHVASAILSGLGLVISGISCYAETRGKLRQARASSPYHYLLALNEELGIEAFTLPK